MLNQSSTSPNNFSKIGPNTVSYPGEAKIHADDGVIDLFDFDGVLCLDRSGRVTSEVKALLNRRRALHPINIVSRREKDSIYSKAIYTILDLEGIRGWFAHIIIKNTSKREHISEIKAIYGSDKHYILYDDTPENIRDCSALATCIPVDGKIGLKEYHFKKEEDAIILYSGGDEKKSNIQRQGERHVTKGIKNVHMFCRRRSRITPSSRWQRILERRFRSSR